MDKNSFDLICIWQVAARISPPPRHASSMAIFLKNVPAEQNSTLLPVVAARTTSYRHYRFKLPLGELQNFIKNPGSTVLSERYPVLSGLR